MPTPPLSDETLWETVDVIQKLGGPDRYRAKTEAAKALGIDHRTIYHRLKVAAQRGMLTNYPAPMPGFEISKQTDVLGENGEVVKRFIQQTPEAGEQFEVPEGHRIKGVSAFVGPDGRVTHQWIKTKEGELSLEETTKQIAEALAEHEGQAPQTAPPAHTEDDLATVYVAADWHVGLLAWKEETGDDYDLKIGRRVIETAMSRLVAGTPNSKQAVVLGLGDLMHIDGYAHNTPKSNNPLDADGRYPKVLYAATHLILYTIDVALQKHERVLVRILRGNHDEQSALAIALALALYYRGNERVEIDDDPGLFWWWSFGAVLLGATHGDKAKMKDLPLIMAARNSEAWGRSKFRHILTGHIHTQTGIELSGVTVESFQSPVAPDAWHVGQGYGANRSVNAITYHRTDGEISRHRVNIL